MNTCNTCTYATTQKVWRLFPVAYCGHPASAHPVTGAPTLPCATAREGHSCEGCRPSHCGIDARLYRAPDAPQRPRLLPDEQPLDNKRMPLASDVMRQSYADVGAWIQKTADAVHGGEAMSTWEHKDIWRKYGRDFLVEVSRHKSGDENKWAVYAYIYPKHPHFAAFSGTDMWQPAANALPLHWGASYLQQHINAKGETTSWQVGSDYAHLHDDFNRCVTQEDAWEVFGDAERLIDHLNAMHEATA